MADPAAIVPRTSSLPSVVGSRSFMRWIPSGVMLVLVLVRPDDEVARAHIEVCLPGDLVKYCADAADRYWR